MSKLPSLVFTIVFSVMLALTQLLTYQQYKISKEKHKNELVQEAAVTKSRLRNILFNDIAAANTLAIIYKEYGIPAKFDSVASKILNNSRYAQALQITEKGIVKNVYPDTPYKATVGINVNADPLRKGEEMRAVDRKDIYFAGPRRLRFGDTGILGKVPIIVNNNVVAVATVLTRLNIIKKELEHVGIDKNKFAYQLVKVDMKGTIPFLISDAKPAQKSEHVYSKIPEGDWLLRVSYTDSYAITKFPYELSAIGILLSIAAGLLAYRKAREPDHLKKIIDEKTNQLAKSERYFRTLIETSSDAIVLLDIEGKVLYQTLSTEKILGYTLSEIQKLDGLELIHPDDRAKSNNMFEELVNNQGSIIYQSHRIQHKNGNYIHIEGAYRNLLHDENVKAIVYSYKDVTDKVLSEQQLAVSNTALELSKKMYSELFNFSPLPAWVADINSLRFLDVNNAAVLHYGYTREEFLSMSLREIRPVEEIPNMERAVNETVNQKEGVYSVILIHKKKNGKLMNVEIQVAPINYSGVKANIAIATDITERQSYIKAIEEQNIRLREISWIQSHIVRAPLARIMGLIPMLKDSTDTAEEQKKVLDCLLESAFELDETIKDITDKSKIEDF